MTRILRNDPKAGSFAQSRKRSQAFRFFRESRSSSPETLLVATCPVDNLAVNARHKDRKTTREDIAYLTDLLDCANQKLRWEKRMGVLHKRVPLTLERVSKAINDPQAPPSEEVKAGLVQALRQIQAAVEQLESVKLS